jgi:hypothetical protein
LLILIDPTSRAEKLVLVLEAIAEFLDDEKVQQTDLGRYRLPIRCCGIERVLRRDSQAGRRDMSL